MTEKSGPRWYSRSGGANNILDVLDNQTKANFQENLNGKCAISKSKGVIGNMVSPFVGGPENAGVCHSKKLGASYKSNL